MLPIPPMYSLHMVEGQCFLQPVALGAHISPNAAIGMLRTIVYVVSGTRKLGFILKTTALLSRFEPVDTGATYLTYQ